MHHEVPVEVRPYIPFFRVWCLCEVFYAAITEGIAIVMKAGHYSLLEESFNHKLWGVLSAANPELQSDSCGDLHWKEEIFYEPA
eukprot:gene27878-30929_t